LDEGVGSRHTQKEAKMEKRKLGITDLQLTTVGLGTWAIGGGDNPFGWGSQDDNDSIATIRHSLDLGINWIDTAKGYGHGHSEEVVGKAIKGRRDEVYLATKCGILWKEDGSDIYGHLKADSIKAECESSLKRLQTDVIDLYQIHWPMPDEDIEEGWGAVADLVKEGKVRHAGVSNFSVDQMKRIQKIHPIASLQPPYSMLKRDIEKDVLGYCARNNIGVIVYSPMQAGLLSGKFTRARATTLPADDWRKNDDFFREPRLGLILNLVEKLRPIAAQEKQPVANLAIAWTLRRPEVTGAIAGARFPGQIEETFPAMDLKLRTEEWARVDIILAEYESRVAEL
jgi:aryl-alcohol dehydrogenase-like predicted oxidoreductase